MSQVSVFNPESHWACPTMLWRPSLCTTNGWCCVHLLPHPSSLHPLSSPVHSVMWRCHSGLCTPKIKASWCLLPLAVQVQIMFPLTDLFSVSRLYSEMTSLAPTLRPQEASNSCPEWLHPSPSHEPCTNSSVTTIYQHLALSDSILFSVLEATIVFVSRASFLSFLLSVMRLTTFLYLFSTFVFSVHCLFE